MEVADKLGKKLRNCKLLTWWSRRNLIIYNTNAKLEWRLFLKHFEHIHH